MLKVKKYRDKYFKLLKFKNEMIFKYPHKVFLGRNYYDYNKYSNIYDKSWDLSNNKEVIWMHNINYLKLREYTNYMLHLKDNLVILDWTNIDENKNYINQSKTLPVFENSTVIALHCNHFFLQWWKKFMYIYPFLNKNTLLICKEQGLIPVYPNENYYKYGEFVEIKKNINYDLYLQYFSWPRVNFSRMDKPYFYSSQIIRRLNLYKLLSILSVQDENAKDIKIIFTRNTCYEPSYNPIKSSLRAKSRLDLIIWNYNKDFQPQNEWYPDYIENLRVKDIKHAKILINAYKKIPYYKIPRFTSKIKFNGRNKGFLLFWPTNKTNAIIIPANKIKEPFNVNTIYPFFVGLLDSCAKLKLIFTKHIKDTDYDKKNETSNQIKLNNNIYKSKHDPEIDFVSLTPGERIKHTLKFNIVCEFALPLTGPNCKLMYSLKELLGFKNPIININSSQTKLTFTINSRRDMSLLLNIWDTFPPLSPRMIWNYFKLRTLFFIGDDHPNKDFIYETLNNSPEFDRSMAYYINKNKEHSLKLPIYYDDWLAGYFTGNSIITLDNDSKLSPVYIGIYCNYNESCLLHYFKIRFNMTSPICGAVPGEDMATNYFANKIHVGAYAEEDLLKLLVFFSNNPPFGQTFYNVINFYSYLIKVNLDSLPYNNYLDNMPDLDD